MTIVWVTWNLVSREGNTQKLESLFYIISPNDIVVARPRDLDDHISWLMEKQK